MKITELHIEGFRSLKNVTWKPGDLNVIIGPNGSGKSNLLRVIEIISASAQNQLSKYIQAAGGIQAIFWDGQISDIRLSISTPAVHEINLPQMIYSSHLIGIGRGGAYKLLDELLRNGSKVGEAYLTREGMSARVYDTTGPMTISPNAVSDEESVLSTAKKAILSRK